MSNLLKADLYALRKNKMTYILLAVCVGLSLMSLGLYAGINLLAGELLEESAQEVEELGGAGFSELFSARGLMLGTFSLTQNAGLIIPIFTGILILADVRHGTIRNKVISGKSRVQIYLSHLIVATLVCVGAVLLTFGVTAGGALPLFGYGVPFDGAEGWNLARCVTVGTLTFVWAASVATFFAMVTKSTPLTIILTVATSFLLTLLVNSSFLIPTDEYDTLYYLIPTCINSYVTSTGQITTEMFAWGVGSLLFFTAANTAAGILIFRKTDLK